MLVEVKSSEEFYKILSKYRDKLVIADFWAIWCPPCLMLKPILERIGKERDDVVIVKVNVDRIPDLANDFGIRAIPTLIAFYDGKPVDRKVGFQSREALISWISILKVSLGIP